ncbi:metallophosphoesterase family protein [Effusibacillus consociatus]|uniref:Exonuclease SbcCD subunit D n=1 Tax=Effusibacillus consociatus TaxID=1117041 RepID=A0ABV9PY07_9BACL
MTRSVRFLQFGDVHLGTAFRGSGFSKQAADRRAHELLATFRKACESALEHAVDFISITGDLFEGIFIDDGHLQEIKAMFKELAPLPILITPGNHDPLTVDSPYRRVDWGSHVHIYGPQVERVELMGGICGVWGFGYPSTIQRENPYRNLRLADSESIEIVMIHGSVDAPEGSPYLPISRAEIRRIGADYAALAHYHQKEMIWEEAGRIRAAYSGSLEPLGFDELGEHGAFLVEAEKGGARLTWLPLAKRSYQMREIDVTGCESVREITSRAREAIPADEWERNLIRIRLVGSLDAGIDLEHLKREWSESGFWIQVENDTRLDYDLDSYTPESIHGRFVKLMRERIVAEPDERRKEVLELALTIGLDALTYGRVINR